ncbi:hypothetical protein [Actinomadura parmotrematis]|uniref:Rpn family recombination-promoting nuclease/putative transposase n=1 Tax=Actinomadura parmotrematis TaxID=2864039 RepID=A0ABS7FYI2_9ACTN|nr:hypothetical protein [Actinomadura parmotrematis]MBW8484647.1 hypothetical protein [Actinomadura parmotrematis]
MPASREHEAIADLFRWNPHLAAEILDVLPGVDLPEYLEACESSESHTDAHVSEFKSDSTVLLKDADGNPRCGVIVEVQLSPPRTKRWTWPVYLSLFRARNKCPVVLLVIAPDPSIAAACAHPIITGHPKYVLIPIVVGPDRIPVVTDPAEIVADPAMSVLSAAFHATGPHGPDILEGLAEGAQLLQQQAPDEGERYIDSVLAVLPRALRDSMEKKMAMTGRYEYKSDLLRNNFAKGEQKGKIESTITVLEARGFSVDDDTRERVLSCGDAAEADRLLTRAAIIESLDELFE